MKLVFTLIVTVFLFSCEKNNETCWECEVSCPGNDYTTTVCQDEEPRFTDANGNNCASHCVRK